MSRRVITVSKTARVQEAVALLRKYSIRHLPVVDRRGALMGIITVVDLLAAVIEFMGLLTVSSRLDVRLPKRPEAFEEVLRII